MSEPQLSQISLKCYKNIRNTSGKILQDSFLWDRSKDCNDDSNLPIQGSLRPVSVNVETSNAAELSVSIDGLIPTGSWWLYGHQGNTKIAVSNKPIQVEEADPNTSYTSLCVVMFKPPWARKDFPWGFAGDINWELREASPSTGRSFQLGIARLEIYGIAQPLPSFFGGTVDVEFLRTFLLPARSSSAIDWPRHVAKALFWDFGFRYKSYGGGAPSYASDYLSSTFHLRRWTKDAGQHELLNCYDQAGIVQIALGLAPPQIGKCQIVYLYPYGYLNRTELVGRGFTNNPFPGDTEEALKKANSSGNGNSWLVDRNDPTRSKFSNHTFVRLGGDNGFIIDACAGPHLGTETIEQYIAAAISPKADGKEDDDPDSTTLYGVKSPGTPGDLIKSHHGVKAINTCDIPSPEAFAKKDKTRYSKSSMATATPPQGIPTDPVAAFKLSQFTEALETAAGIDTLSPDLRFNDYGAHVTYDIPYFLDNGTEKDQIDVQIVVLKDNQAAQNQFEWDLHNYHHTDPEQWTKLEDADFSSRLSLANAGAEHGVIVWVRGQISIRIEGHPSSKELWDIYGKKLDDIARIPRSEDPEDFNVHIRVPSLYQDQSLFYIELGINIRDNISWRVVDTTPVKTDNEEESLLYCDWGECQMSYHRGPDLMTSGTGVLFCPPQNVGAHTLHWNFANEDDSLRVYSCETLVEVHPKQT